MNGRFEQRDGREVIVKEKGKPFRILQLTDIHIANTTVHSTPKLSIRDANILDDLRLLNEPCNSHGMGYKKRERSVQPGGAAQHPQAHHYSAAPTAPVYRPAKQLQKGDHRNGYF